MRRSPSARPRVSSRYSAMIEAPGTAPTCSSMNTGVVPAGFICRNSVRRSKARSSTSIGVHAEFAKDKTHETRMRAKGMMIKRRHGQRL